MRPFSIPVLRNPGEALTGLVAGSFCLCCRLRVASLCVLPRSWVDNDYRGRDPVALESCPVPEGFTQWRHWLQLAPPSPQKRAPWGWFKATLVFASAKVRPSSNCLSYGSRVHETTTGWASPLRLTTIRDEAHITASGDLWRIPQHASVISATSASASISGNKVSWVGPSRPARAHLSHATCHPNRSGGVRRRMSL